MEPEERRPTSIGIRLLWISIAACIVVLILQVAIALRGSPTSLVAKPHDGEITVSDAIARGPQRPVAVRGFVFMRKGFPPRLCSGVLPTDPPSCQGPFLDIDGLDLNRVVVQRGSDHGVPIAWSREDIAILGQVVGAQIHVDEILS